MPSSAVPSTVVGSRLDLYFSFPLEDWVGKYDAFQVWRSRLSPGGPFEQLTGPLWGPAVLTTSVVGKLLLVGLDLKLLVDELFPLILTFTGTNPLTPGQVATQIQAGSSGLLLCVANPDGTVSIETRGVGSVHVLRCGGSAPQLTGYGDGDADEDDLDPGGQAAPLLGLSSQEPESVAFGTDVYVPLISGQTEYVYSDVWGGGFGNYYKTRYIKLSDRTVSDFSPPFQKSPPSPLGATNLATGTLVLVDATGLALVHREVLIYSDSSYLAVAGANVLESKNTYYTDAQGSLAVTLVRGAVVDVAIGGTALRRRLTVPNTARFNLFDPTLSDDDGFRVVVPDQQFADRRSF